MSEDEKPFPMLLEEWLALPEKERWLKMRDYSRDQEELGRKTRVRPKYQMSKVFQLWAVSKDGIACLNYLGDTFLKESKPRE